MSWVRAVGLIRLNNSSFGQQFICQTINTSTLLVCPQFAGRFGEQEILYALNKRKSNHLLRLSVRHPRLLLTGQDHRSWKIKRDWRREQAYSKRRRFTSIQKRRPQGILAWCFSTDDAVKLRVTGEVPLLWRRCEALLVSYLLFLALNLAGVLKVIGRGWGELVTLKS